MATKARIALNDNLKDVERLLELHTQEGGDAPGRRHGLEVLNKSAIVLITSYWEAYCEDLAAEALEHIVTHARTSDVLPKKIKKLIAKDLTDKDKVKNELAIWDIADDKWRGLLRKRLQNMRATRNKKLNTPNSTNVDDLFDSVIGLSKVSSQWVWVRNPAAQRSRDKLDKYVKLRCEIAHRGRADTSVRRTQVEDYYRFIRKIATRTGSAVSRQAQSITGKKLGSWSSGIK